MRFVLLAVLVGCTAPQLLEADAPAERPLDQLRHYTIWLGGARVGTAIEHEVWSRDGLRLRRDEMLRFRRGEAEVALATTITIDTDSSLVAHHVRWTEIGAEQRGAEAIRDHEGWRIIDAAGGALPSLPATAVPAELVPLLVRRDGSFTGTVFLPARGFVSGRGRIQPVAETGALRSTGGDAPVRLVARLALDTGPVVEATIDLDPDGSPARVVDGEGVIAIRATAAQARMPFAAVDLIAATALPIAGFRHRARLVLDGDLALPAVPGQVARSSPAGLEIELSPALAGDLPPGLAGPDRAREIGALVAAVRAHITPDLGATPRSAARAASARTGDCTTFALAYAAIATRRSIPTRVVTGLRVDGDRLIRHRWAVSWTGRSWIAVDAAFGAAPAGGDLIGLAIHDADDAGLVSGEAALMQVRGATWD